MTKNSLQPFPYPRVRQRTSNAPAHSSAIRISAGKNSTECWQPETPRWFKLVHAPRIRRRTPRHATFRTPHEEVRRGHTRFVPPSSPGRPKFVPKKTNQRRRKTGKGTAPTGKKGQEKREEILVQVGSRRIFTFI